jgi:glutathione peroxidase
MKKLITFGFVIWALGFGWFSGIHSYTVPKIEGGSQALSAYQGKKILVITLPLVQNPAADSLLYSLDTLAAAHTSTLKVIAVPAVEDGYTSAQKTALQQWYRSKLGNHILITEGLYTRKTSGTQQHPLFKWLTSDTQNDAFDIDVEGPGFKFFANEEGKLYGVLRSHSTISGASVQKTLLLD